MAQENVIMKMEGTMLCLMIDTAHPTDAMSKTKLSHIVGTTHGWLPVKFGAQAYRVQVRVDAPIPKGEAYAVKRGAYDAKREQGIADLVAIGVPLDAATAQVEKLIGDAPREPKPSEATVATALEKARTTGIAPTEAPVTPPPAKPGKARVEVQIAPRKSR